MKGDVTFERVRSALEAYDKESLIDLLYHLMRTYVVEGTRTLNPDLAIVDFPRHLRDLSFPQLVVQLKAHLDLPELSQFSVVSNEVFVAVDDAQISLTAEAARPLTPREQDQPATPQKGSMPPPAGPAKAAATSRGSNESPPTFGGGSTASDEGAGDGGNNRFSMLDID